VTVDVAGTLHPAKRESWTIVGAAVIALVLVVVYHRTAVALWHAWRTDDNYSHGPLVPLVSAALAWRARHRWRAAATGADARGIALVALACAIQVIGMRASVLALECDSMLVMAFGLSLTFQGTARTRVLAFPLAYLVFMTIFPPFVVLNLSYALKDFTVGLAAHLAEACGVILQRSGMTLFLASGPVRIENPCSGLRSLVALLATGAVFAHLQPGGVLRRAVLLVAAVPLAMLGNALRITLILVVGHYGSVKQATGAFHDQSGYWVYAGALAGLLLLRHLLTPKPAPMADAR
jgi:exosortase